MGYREDNPPANATCHLYKTASGTVASGSIVVADFAGATTIADTDSMADVANDKITIQTDGAYLVGGFAEVQHSGTYLGGAYIYIDGTQVYANQSGTQGGFVRHNVCGIAHLSSGADIDLRVFQNSGAARTMGDRRLFAVLLYPT